VIFYLFFYTFIMKNIFSTTLILTGLLLSACGSSTVDMPMDDMMGDDHHMGESDVMPHGHDDEAMDDMMDEMMDDHHEGEDNVQPHEEPKEDDSAPKPPSRGEADMPHDDTNTDPHGH
jgi:hypothetical protein